MGAMKTVQRRYSTTSLDIQVPDAATVLEYGTDAFPVIDVHPDPKQAVRSGFPPPSDPARAGDHVVIAFDDGFKSTTADRYVIPIMIDTLTAAGVRDEDIELVAAVGGHRKCMPLELPKQLLGPELYLRFCPFGGGASPIRNHNCTEGNAYLGVSDTGDHVECDRAVQEADLVVNTGSIKPLGFGGDSGQGVSIGLAGAWTVDSLHRHAVYRAREALHGECDPAKNVYRKHKLAVHRKIEEATESASSRPIR